MQQRVTEKCQLIKKELPLQRKLQTKRVNLPSRIYFNKDHNKRHTEGITYVSDHQSKHYLTLRKNANLLKKRTK